MARSQHRITPLIIFLTVALVACGDNATTTSTPTTTAVSITSATTSTLPPTSTTVTSQQAGITTPATDLPTQLEGGTYLVGSEIRVGAWVGDMCGCSWAYVDPQGNEVRGTTEHADIRASDHAIWLAPCGWSFLG